MASVATTTLCVCYYLLTWDYTYFGSDDDIYFGYLYFLCLLLELTPSVSYLFILYRKVGGPEQEPIISSRDAISPSTSQEGFAMNMNNFKRSGELYNGSNFNSYGGVGSEIFGSSSSSFSSRLLSPTDEITTALSGAHSGSPRRASTNSVTLGPTNSFNSNTNDISSSESFRGATLSNSELETKSLINNTDNGNVSIHKIAGGNVVDVESK